MRRFWPFAVDVLLVVLFCVIGRRSHEEAVFTGLLHTVWPFATGLAAGWLAAVLLDRRRPGEEPFAGTRLWPTGVLIWASTLVVGMLLRVLAGQGTAISFIVVAGLVLALFLLGWRGAARAFG